MRPAVVFVSAFVLLLAAHGPILSLPYFWDELGQFVPAALDILRDGAWVPHSTTPNVHPPAVMAYLALVWRVFGYSIPITRIAMLAVAAVGVAATFALARRLNVSAWWTVAILVASPLFFAQSMLAQLDMPAMAISTVALVLFIDKRYAWCAACCTLLVLVKETSVVAPMVFAAWLWWQGERRKAAYFLAPVVALGVWLIALRSATGHVLGDPGFAHYNVGYALQPVRAMLAILRRIFYLFLADFRFLGTIGLLLLCRRVWRGRTTGGRSVAGWLRERLGESWIVCAIFAVLQTLLVSVLGGAALERYLLPVFPILCAAFAGVPNRVLRVALVAGLLIGLRLNPPYPFPFENNLAVVDFVRVQQQAASYIDSNLANEKVASAWPFTGALSRPEFGYVSRPVAVIETNDFHPSTFNPQDARVVVVYTRVWEGGLTPMLSPLLRRYYDHEEPISEAKLAGRHFRIKGRWTSGRQSAEVYVRDDLRQ